MQKSIITDLNRCVGCLSCSVACKALNGVAIGHFWNEVLRVGPNPINPGDDYPNVYMYFLPKTCQHCGNPQCVDVCPTGAAAKLDDGTVQVDSEACIGCGLCLDACPYGVRYIDEDTNVAMKCTMCHDTIDPEVDVPQCVSQCAGNARWFGDLDEGYESFVGTYGTDVDRGGVRYRMLDFINPFTEDEVYSLGDASYEPSCRFILRGHTWYGEDTTLDDIVDGSSAPLQEGLAEAAALAKEEESKPYALHPYALKWACGSFGGTAAE